MNIISRALVGAALTCLLPLAAEAHVTLEVPEARAGSYYKATFRVGHGCRGAPTDTVRITIPDGIGDIRPMPKPGWTLETVKGAAAGPGEAAEGVREVTWSGGRLEHAHYDEFVFRARIAPEAGGRTIYFPVTQLCGSEQMAWTEIPAPGVDPRSLKAPAPRLRVVAGPQAASSPIAVTASWARATPPAAKVGAGYLTITNRGQEPDRLLGGASDAAGRVEVHEMRVIDGTMRMRPLEAGLAIKPGETVELKPGSFHLMLMNLKRPLKEGESVPTTLNFEKAGAVPVTLEVQGIGASAAPSEEHQHH